MGFTFQLCRCGHIGGVTEEDGGTPEEGEAGGVDDFQQHPRIRVDINGNAGQSGQMDNYEYSRWKSEEFKQSQAVSQAVSPHSAIVT